MQNHKISSANYLKAIELGFYEKVKCISVFNKTVKHYKACGRVELLNITITN
jgi:hypothetical protein